MTTASPFVVLSRGEKRRVLFEGSTLPAARGFVEGCRRPSEILMRAQQSAENVEDLYTACIVDTETGQILAEGPTLNLFEMGDLLSALRVVVLPVCVVKGDIR